MVPEYQNLESGTTMLCSSYAYSPEDHMYLEFDKESTDLVNIACLMRLLSSSISEESDDGQRRVELDRRFQRFLDNLVQSFKPTSGLTGEEFWQLAGDLHERGDPSDPDELVLRFAEEITFDYLDRKAGLKLLIAEYFLAAAVEYGGERCFQGIEGSSLMKISGSALIGALCCRAWELDVDLVVSDVLRAYRHDDAVDSSDTQA